MKQSLTTILVIIVLVGLGAFGYQYFTDQQAYISTDNATVEADLYTLDATQTGVLTDWEIKEGDEVKEGDIVGKVANRSLTTTVNATVVKTSVYAKQNVYQGQTLAQLADLSDTYILAYIDVNEISQVKTGQDVKVKIESLSDNTFEGKVIEVVSGTGSFYNESASTSTAIFTEQEKQRVPVKIAVNDLPINRLTLGVHAEVKIER